MSQIHAFHSFVGNCPATVEWQHVAGEPTVTAVYISHATRGPCSVHQDLSPDALAEFDRMARVCAKNKETTNA